MILQNKAKTVIFVSSISLLLAATAEASQPKHVMVPPQEINQQKLAPAASKGVFSHLTMLPIQLDSQPSSTLNSKGNKGKSQSIQQSIYFDGSATSPVMLIGPGTKNWQVDIFDANGKNIRNHQSVNNVDPASQRITIGNQNFEGQHLLVDSPSVGQWQVKIKPTISQQSKSTNRAQKQPDAYLLFKGDPNYKLYTYRDNNFTTENSDVNVVAYLMNADNAIGKRAQMLSKRPLENSISKAMVTITGPDGTTHQLRMVDDGTRGDKVAGDGHYTAQLPTDITGTYTSQVFVQGVRPDGLKYSRSAADLYEIEKVPFSVAAKSARLTNLGNEQAEVSIPVRQLTQQNRVFVSGEIFGTGVNGKPEAAAWLGGIAALSASDSDSLNLQFDTRWLKRKKLTAPLEIRNLRFQSADSNTPLFEVEKLSLNADRVTSSALLSHAKNIKLSAVSSDYSADISQSMLAANAPMKAKFESQATANPKLMLVHGYCSGDVWNSGQFANSVKFQDYNKNRSHDAFAQQIINFGNSYSSYGIVAHSQGGAAALHLYSRYWSGLDYATGGRLIQSVGTPYQGTALAGNLAILGQIFGAGCGTNTDLTYSGAANWLSTIPSWARAEVDYYTTSFKTRWWAYDYCHLATDLFLDDPEDGTTEKWSGQLSGAANKGHKKGWCHTTGMRDTAQYKDSSRNASMSSRAAR